MRRANIVLLTMGSAMLISSANALAAPPPALPDSLQFDQYTATNGTITSACPSSDCSGTITGDGFLQRQVTVGGTKYFQTIVLDKGSNISTLGDTSAATFANESFVQQGNGSGIGNKSTLNAAGSGTDFTNLGMTTEIHSGTVFSSDNSAGTDVNVTQNLTGYDRDPVANPTTAVVLSTIGFGLSRGASATAPDISLDSTVYLVDNGVTPDPATSPKQVFALRQLTASSAGYLTTDGTNIVANGGTGADLITKFNGVATGTSPLAFASGDTIQLMWLGQTVNDQAFGAETLAVNPDPATQGIGTGTGSASQMYSSQAAVGDTSVTGTAPYVWSSLFDGVGSGEPLFNP